ncbi:unnamed protein product [Dibothriocephalus latus]|uniref:Phosphofurin acidic cluster sorting protein 1/2 C-terminal domain-containing protein n=1 Tax=Dibothriocephalus latus TaxID=60516 RepID=A0A3P7N1Y3_DIBLA|nr:unnamed protein product [Dibothriocephalus latus]
MLPSVVHSDRTTYELQLEYWSSATSASTSVSVVSGAPSLPLSGGIPQSATALNLGPTRPFTNKVICRGMVVTLKCGGNAQPNLAPNSTIALPKPFSNAAMQLNLVLLTREKKSKIMRIVSGTSPGHPTSVVGRSDSVTASPAGTGNVMVSKSHKFSDHAAVSVNKADDISMSSIFSASQASENLVIRVCIDGVEWPTTKFFQVSPCWRTHVRIFPLVTISPLDDCPSVANFALPVANLLSCSSSTTSP